MGWRRRNKKKDKKKRREERNLDAAPKPMSDAERIADRMAKASRAAVEGRTDDR